MKIKIDTQEWEVKLVVGDMDLETKNWGKTNWETKTLTIDANPNRSPQDIEETLLHELIHAALDRVGRKKSAENEPLVKSLSIKLYDILKTNGFLADIYPMLIGKPGGKNAKKR